MAENLLPAQGAGTSDVVNGAEASSVFIILCYQLFTCFPTPLHSPRHIVHMHIEFRVVFWVEAPHRIFFPLPFRVSLSQKEQQKQNLT